MSVRDASRIAVEAARYPLDLLAQIKEDQRALAQRPRPLSVVMTPEAFRAGTLNEKAVGGRPVRGIGEPI